MEKILLVEDDEVLAIGVEFALKKEGFNLTKVNSAKGAIEKFNSDQFNLIILDINLPDGNGFEICKKIRQKSEVPIIFLTACDEETNVVLGLDIGGDDYITKPFRLREFISRVNAIMRRIKKDCKGSKILSNDILLNVNEMKLFKNGEGIILTKTEYKLVFVFMQNPLNILTRDKIFQIIWDIEGNYIDENTLSVYIRRLREKIESNPSKPEYIITARGLGYMWNQRSEWI